MSGAFWEVVELELPYPPSINHYYVRTRYGTCISAAGKRYRSAVVAIASGEGVARLGKRSLSLSIVVCPPDRAKRDLDNVLKALQDALTHAGVWDDDSDLDALAVFRGPAFVRATRRSPGRGYEGGRIFLRIAPVDPRELEGIVDDIMSGAMA